MSEDSIPTGNTVPDDSEVDQDKVGYGRGRTWKNVITDHSLSVVGIFLVLNIITFFVLGSLDNNYIKNNICLLIVLQPFIIGALIIFGAMLSTTSKAKKYNKDRARIQKQEPEISSDSSLGKEDGSSSSLLDGLTKEKTCDECGSELVYKEDYDSYYCPECHEYK